MRFGAWDGGHTYSISSTYVPYFSPTLGVHVLRRYRVLAGTRRTRYLLWLVRLPEQLQNVLLYEAHPVRKATGKAMTIPQVQDNFPCFGYPWLSLVRVLMLGHFNYSHLVRLGLSPRVKLTKVPVVYTMLTINILPRFHLPPTQQGKHPTIAKRENDRVVSSQKGKQNMKQDNVPPVNPPLCAALFT